MGNHAAILTKSGTSIQVSERTNPGRADWLTEHAIATGLSVVEVERLWLRFQQLGCNADGNITNDILRKNPLYAEDTFLRKLIGFLRDDYRAEGKVTFQSFCNSMYWIDRASNQEKLIAIFNYLNNGNPLDQETVRKILPKIFEHDSEQGYDRLTQRLFEFLGSSTGSNAESYIDQDTFVKYCQEQIPRAKLDTLLAFNIIPRFVTEEARQQLEKRGDAKPVKQQQQQQQQQHLGLDPSDAVYTQPTDAQLAVVAQRACKRDYRLLGNKLGFYESDMSHIDTLYKGDRFQQVYHMLIEWRKREGQTAYVITLQKVLQECLMPDIAAQLSPKHNDAHKNWVL